jgi:bifunctional UDP-N-acetylglucosamine pyrophosphorylase/glucosamine-1-phosphate N-acetyltransferase
MSNAPSSLAVIVLAAGQGARMKSARAKVLHEIAGFSMITHVRRVAEALAPGKIVFVVGPDTPDVAAAVTPHPTTIQKERLGTGHAVLAAREALKGFSGRILVVYGDTPLLRAETLSALLLQKTPVSVLAFEPADPAQYGRVFLNAEGLVERIVESADASAAERAATLCNAGVMAFDSAVLWDLLDAIKPHNAKGEYYLTDAIALACGKGLAVGHVKGDAGEVLGINSRAELAQAEVLMQARLRAAAMEAGATLRDPASVYFSADTRLGRDVVVGQNVVFGVGVEIEDNVEILPFSHLEGVRVRKGARIGPYARLRPGTVIGESAHIGNFVEVKKASIESGAKVNHLSYIGDARVGERTNIGAGTITCNYDGTHKHHTDIGADVFVGSDSALVAPLKIGDGALIAAGSTITDDVPADALAVAREKQVNKPGWSKRMREKRNPGRKSG